MTQQKKTIHVGYWWAFLLTCLLATFLVFLFAVLINAVDQEKSLLTIFTTDVKSEYLNLTLAGALGGMLYSILLDQALELPSWGKNGSSFKPGFIGEIFVGIVGAFIAYLFLPDILRNLRSTDSTELTGIITFAVGVVGGYGGEAILRAALNRIVKRIDEADLVAEEKERLAQKVSQMDLINRQLQDGLPTSEVYNLVEDIKNAPQDIQEEAFRRAKEIRRMSWRTKAFKSEIPKTIPIFEALVESNPSNHQYHAQLGYAYKDSIPPRLEDSISQLDEAIALRGTQIVGTTWKYELNRALARMMQEEQQVSSNGAMSPWRQEIWDDIVKVDSNYGITKVLVESQDEAVDIPLKDWLEVNEDWVRQQRGGTRLLEKAFNVSLSPTPPIDTNVVGENGARIDTGKERKDVKTLKEEAQSGSGGTGLQTRNRSSKSNLLRKNTNWITVARRTKIEATHRTYLKRYTISASELPDDQKVEVPVDGHYYVRKYAPAANNHCLVELDYGYGVWYIWPNHWNLPWEEQSGQVREKQIREKQDQELKTYPAFYTKENLKKIMPYASSSDIATYVDPLNQTLDRFKINTAKRAAAFIAQVAHESGSLRYKEEIASGAAYEGRRDLGNTRPGDGRRYKGRGLIQLTGRHNYRKCGQALGLPLETNPQMVVKDPYTNAVVAGWYWNSRNINAAADAGDFRKVTRLINGGYTHYQDRVKFWERAKKYISSQPVPTPKPEPLPTPKPELLPTPSPDDYNNPQAIQRQIDRLSKYLPQGKTLNLDVKTNYFSQRDNYTQAHRTCNSSSNAMYLDWLLRVTGKPGLGGDNEYLRKVLAKGDTTVHSVQTQIIKQYGFKTKWNTDKDLPFIHDLIEAGFPVPVNILHRGSISRPTGGHVIMLIGYKNDSWIAHDPYGTLESNYSVHNGAYSRISQQQFKARWQGGYRMLA
ncbi:MAG: glycoside hydrolase family 19 protein [Crocosphaera sp.]